MIQTRQHRGCPSKRRNHLCVTVRKRLRSSRESSLKKKDPPLHTQYIKIYDITVDTGTEGKLRRHNHTKRVTLTRPQCNQEELCQHVTACTPYPMTCLRDPSTQTAYPQTGANGSAVLMTGHVRFTRNTNK